MSGPVSATSTSPGWSTSAVRVAGFDGREPVVRQRNRKLVMRRLQLLNALNEFVALCASESVEVRVLKGLATGQLDHVSSNHRRTSDIDVLVRKRDFRRITDLVADGAFEYKADAPSEVLVERTFRMTNKVQLDIHHRLFRFGRGHEDVLFDAPTPLPNGGLAMRREARLVHAAAHLLISPPGHRIMSSLADVAVISQHPDCDVELATDIAQQFGADGVLAHAIWIAENIGRTNPAPEPKVASTLINRAHLRTDRRIDLETLAQLRDLSGFGDRWKLLRYQAGRRSATTWPRR